MSSSSIGDGGIGEYFSQATPSSQTAITAFLAKLWALVNDPSCDDLIAWDPSGGSFHVYDQARFAREILPRYFKHNNFASFIRQLNMYGFRKISTIEHGSLKSEGDDIEFAHPSFIRGHDSLLELIKRRAPDNQQKVNIQSNKTEIPMTTTTSPITTTTTSSSALVSTTNVETKPTRPVELSNVLNDVRTLQNKQTSLSDKLFHMQDENQALWREISILKQKHAKQQQIVSKLMEFLLHFLTNSTHPTRQSVEQQSNNQSQQQQQHVQHHTIINQPIVTNGLKRKPAALMLSEEPKKRTTMQQQQQQHHHNILSQAMNIGRHPGIIINELTDNDTGGWLHTTDTSPLVDLVPSPPPPPVAVLQPLNETYSTQNNYEWAVPTDELQQQQQQMNFPQRNKTSENGNNESHSYIPDFFLTTDQNNGTKNNLLQLDETNLPGINTSSTKTVPLMKEEQIEFSNTFHQQAPNSTTSTSTDTEATYLDDITGDVDHIQSSLDNIRELMFDNLPDGTTIEDLFCDDHALLSPLLAHNGQTQNILTTNNDDMKVINNNNNNNNNHFLYPENSSAQCKQIILHKSEIPLKTSPLPVLPPVTDVNNQLLEQLIYETAKVEEQRQTIHQLEREKMTLEGKIHQLEQHQKHNN